MLSGRRCGLTVGYSFGMLLRPRRPKSAITVPRRFAHKGSDMIITLKVPSQEFKSLS